MQVRGNNDNNSVTGQLTQVRENNDNNSVIHHLPPELMKRWCVWHFYAAFVAFLKWLRY